LLAPSPATGINNQTPPCEILNSCSIASCRASTLSGQLPNSKLSLIVCCLVHDPIAPPYIDR
jgi:hypothetical protein